MEIFWRSSQEVIHPEVLIILIVDLQKDELLVPGRL